MRRYWLQDSDWSEESVELVGEDYHHIVGVCRMSVGDRFEILADGLAHLVELQSVGRKSAIAQKIESRHIEPRQGPEIILALALPKFQVFEAVLEKMVELGVSQVDPLTSDFSFIRSNAEVFSGKQSRFQKIIRGATSQTGRGELMRLGELKTLKAYLAEHFGTNRRDDVLGLFAYEGGRSGVEIATSELDRALAQFGKRLSTARRVILFVGSEGGFSDDEVRMFAEHGLKPTTFGTQVLRVETACVALVSVLKYELRGDNGQ